MHDVEFDRTYGVGVYAVLYCLLGLSVMLWNCSLCIDMSIDLLWCVFVV